MSCMNLNLDRSLCCSGHHYPYYLFSTKNASMCRNKAIKAIIKTVVLHSETVRATHMARYPSRFSIIHSKNRDEEKLRLAKHPSPVSMIDTFKVSRGGDTTLFVLNKECRCVAIKISKQSYLHSETVRVAHKTRYPSRFSMIQSKSRDEEKLRLAKHPPRVSIMIDTFNLSRRGETPTFFDLKRGHGVALGEMSQPKTMLSSS